VSDDDRAAAASDDSDVRLRVLKASVYFTLMLTQQAHLDALLWHHLLLSTYLFTCLRAPSSSQSLHHACNLRVFSWTHYL